MYEETGSVHKSKNLRCLKRNLNFSHVYLERRQVLTTTLKVVRKTLEGSLVKQELEEKKVELIFINKFSVNTHWDKFFGWRKNRWMKYFKTDFNDFLMNFFMSTI